MAWGVPKIGAVAEANGGNLTLAEPAGIAQGDLMVACFAIRSTVGFTNSDWVKVESQLTGNTVSTGAGIASAELWVCVRGASAPTLLFSRTGGDVARGLIIAYAGGKKNVTAVQSVHSSNTLAVAALTATTGTISTVEANELIVAMIGHGDNYTTSAFDAATDPTTASGATDTTTAPTAGTWIERSDSGTNTGADTALGVADAIRATAGATGTIQCTSSGSARHAMIAAAFRLLVDTTVSVGLGAVTIAGFAPTATATVAIQTGLGAVTIAGFAPTVTVSVQNTNVVTGLGAVTTAGFAPTVAVAPALNYAILFDASAYSRLGDEGSPITDIKNATKLGFTMRVRGDLLTTAAIGATDALVQIAAGYCGGSRNDTGTGTTWQISLNCAGVGSICNISGAKSGIDAAAYYTIRGWRDVSATHDFGIELFDPTGSLVTSQTSDTDATFTNGTYGDFSLNFDGSNGASPEPLVCDWAACWDRIPPGVGTAPSEPGGGETGLLHWHKWNENGGTVGDDQQSATNSVLTGTYSWILISTGTSATPALGAVTIAGFAPQVNLGIVPALGAVTVAGFAPSAIADTKITTGLGAVTIAGFAPSAVVDTKITTGLGAVTVAGFAPTVQLPVTVTTGLGDVTIAGFGTTLGLTIYGEAGAVTLAGFSPTVVTPNTVTTDVGAVAVVGFAPTVQLPILVTTDTGTVTTTGFAPSIVIGVNVFPDVGSVTLAGFSPTVTSSDHQTVSTQLGVVTITGFAPSVNLAVTPGLGQVTVAGFAPSVLVSDNQTATPQTGDVTLDGFAPTLVLPVTVTTDLGAITIAGFTPTISVTAGTILTDLGHVTIAGFAPTVTATAHQTVTTGLGAVTIAGFAPQVNVTATPGTGLVSIAGFAPLVATTNNQTVTPGLGSVVLAGFAPTVAVSIQTGLGAVTVAGFAPTVQTPVTVATGLGSVIEVGYRPTITASNHQTVTTGVGAITVSGFAPSAAVDFSVQTQTGTVDVAGFAPALINPAGVTPGTGIVTITGFAPTVDIPVVLIPVIAGPLYPLTPGLLFRAIEPGLQFRAVQPALTMQAVVGDFPTVEASGDNLPHVPIVVTPDVGAITIDGLAPTVDTTSNVVATPGVGLLDVTGFAPIVGATISAAPDVGTVDLEGFGPTVGFSGSATPDVGLVDLVGLAPIVDVQGIDFVLTLTGAVTVVGFAPTASATANVAVTPGVGSITVTGLAPRANGAINTGLGQVTVTGFVPTAIANRTVTPAAGVVTIAGFAPTVTASAPVTVTPSVGVVTLAGFAPTFDESEHPNEPASMTVLHTHDASSIQPTGWLTNEATQATYTVTRGDLQISGGDAKKFKTTRTLAYRIAGTDYTKAATDNLTFSAAHQVSANKFGGIVLQINAAGTFSTKVSSTPQAYNTWEEAYNNLPTADAGNVICGWFDIGASGSTWTANTDNLSTSTPFKIPRDYTGFIRTVTDGTFPGNASAVLELSAAPVTNPGSGYARIDSNVPAATNINTFGATQVYVSMWQKISAGFVGNDGAGSLKNFLVHHQATYGGLPNPASHLLGLFNTPTGDMTTVRIRPAMSVPNGAAHDGITADNNFLAYYPDLGETGDPGDLFSRDTWHFLEGLVSFNSPGNNDGDMQGWVDGVSPVPANFSATGADGLRLQNLRYQETVGLRFTGLEWDNVWGGGGTKFLITGEHFNCAGDIYVSGGYARAGERPNAWTVSVDTGGDPTPPPNSEVPVKLQLKDDNGDPVGLFNPNPTTITVTNGTWVYRAGTPPNYEEAKNGVQLITVTVGSSGTCTVSCSDFALVNNGSNGDQHLSNTLSLPITP